VEKKLDFLLMDILTIVEKQGQKSLSPEKFENLVESLNWIRINKDPKLKEVIEWLNKLIDYATGKKDWNTDEDWVCEAHPLMPCGMGYSFDCDCGAPSMPPFRPNANAKSI